MTNIILCGCNGKMGAAVQNFVNQRADCSIVAGVDVSGGGNGSFPVYTSLADVEEEAQVVVDFSHPSALSSILEYCRSHSGTAAATAQSRPRRFKRQPRNSHFSIPAICLWG